MANNDSFPDYSEKQKLLFVEKKNPDLLKSFGEKFFKAEMFDTSLDFFMAAEDREKIKEIIEVAVDKGDFYLFKKAAFAVIDEKETEEKIAKLAQNAGKLGKNLFSKDAADYTDKKNSAKELNSGKEENVG